MTNVNSITIGHTAKLNMVIWNEEPVLTFKMIDDAHAKSTATAKVNFSRNRDKFIEGKHFYLVSFDEAEALRPYGVEVPPRGLTLITKRGYSFLVKSFTDDLSWQVQDQLVDYYFEGKTQHEVVEPITAIQLKALRDQMENVTRYMKHDKASLSQTLWRNLKADLGYDKIEAMPATQYQEAMDWINSYQNVAHRVLDITRGIERQFIGVLKGQRQKPEDQCRAMLKTLEAPLAQLEQAA